MKPKTWNMIKDRLFENMKDMEICEEEGSYNEMERENETMEWICNAEGKKRQFKLWHEKCAIGVQLLEEEDD